MCRLLGYVSRTPTTIVDVVGADEFEHFRRLARVHGDGWGAAWPQQSGISIATSPEPADDSERFRRFAGDHESYAALVHLRRATQGLAVCAENTHPFGDDEIAFAHNGSILPPESAADLIPAGADVTLVGDTDSERLYAAVRGRMQVYGEDAAAALAATLRAADEELEFTSCNCMVLTQDTLVVASLFRPEMVRQYAAFEMAPDYYEMRYRVTDSAVIANSSGWPQDGWTPLRNGEVLTVDRATLAVSIETLTAVPGRVAR